MAMSSISMGIPILQINNNELQNLISFIYKHEHLLKEFGAIKIQLNIGCKLSLYKRAKKCVSYPVHEEIVKMNKNESIYFVEKVDHIDKSVGDNSLIKGEYSFWSLLSCLKNNRRQLNISLLPNKSFFYQKASRLYFDIHRLPKQSILKLAGRNFLSQFIPCLRRAHGPGAIFPLSCAQQQLFSINYHHEGGNHHWYIIPNHQRDLLQKIIDQEDSSICLDHGQLFINPLILDKNQIRYHRIIQHPNEFIVLSSGTLSQSFTENASWSESIDFALPSWIEQAHHNHSLPLCQCNSLPQTIDFNLFKHELIQKYIISHLDNYKNHHIPLNLKDNNYMDIDRISTSNSNKTDSLHDETMMSTNADAGMSLKPIISSFQSLSPTSLTISSINSAFSEKDREKLDDINSPAEYQILEQGHFRDVSGWKTYDVTLIDSAPGEHLSERDVQTFQPYETTTASTNIHQNVTNNCNEDNWLLSFEELMDFLPLTEDTTESMCAQDDESTYTSNRSTLSTDTHTIVANKQFHVTKKKASNQTINNRKTLFVSGLKSDVKAKDIRHHFIDTTKVIIKACRRAPHLKYALVIHRTSQAAKINIQRPIDPYLFGHQCRVEYSNNCFVSSSNQQTVDPKKIVVTQIPVNVSENDLCHLFVNGHVLRYCPALNIHFPATTKEMKNNKFLLGYAFIRYNNEQQAANVIQHADQYQINGQQLVVSLYRNKTSMWATRRKLFSN